MNYKTEDLEKALDTVCDPKDWKAPIEAVVKNEADQAIIAEAIEFFTATIAEFTKDDNGRLWVVADGYRMGPAGP